MVEALCIHVQQVTPIIGVIDDHTRKQLQSNAAEVQSVFDAPLLMFLRQSEAHSQQDVTWAPGIDYRVHFFQHTHNGTSYTIWVRHFTCVPGLCLFSKCGDAVSPS